jgi:hypothetical protein
VKAGSATAGIELPVGGFGLPEHVSTIRTGAFALVAKYVHTAYTAHAPDTASTYLKYCEFAALNRALISVIAAVKSAGALPEFAAIRHVQ